MTRRPRGSLTPAGAKAGTAAGTQSACEPDGECQRCQRLVVFRLENRAAEPTWHNAPVSSWGSLQARLLIVGLAPGRGGANRTGRPFTGDWAGDLLYETLLDFGFAHGSYGADPNDGLSLADCRITNAVRCVPPANKPTGDEIAACRPFLATTLASMPNLKAIVALGRVAHASTLAALQLRQAACKFAHGARHQVAPAFALHDSFHCSRYNTNTGVLTRDMFRAVFSAVQDELQVGSAT